ncbi:L-cystine transport system permease protein TcyL [compost metagenome]
MGRGEAIIGATAHFLEVYISLSIIYYVTVIGLEKLFAVSERRLQRHERRLAAR